MLCSVVKHLGSGRALKKWGKTLDCVSCFPLHFFLALPLPACFTTEHSRDFFTASSPVARDRSRAKGEMGREEKAKRLANPVSKMADELMADFPEFPRPVHEAVIVKKIICPGQNCC